MLTHQSLDFGACGGGGSHCALWFGFVLLCFVLFCFVFMAEHVTGDFVRELYGQECRFTLQQVGGEHLSFVRKRLLKQEEEAEEAPKEMALTQSHAVKDNR